MSGELNLTQLPQLPQAEFLHQLAPALWQRPEVQAVWLEGSMGRGNADLYSDVDLYVAVDTQALDEWRTLDVAALFGKHYAAHLVSNFAEDFFVYHVYLQAGGIYDLHIQPRNRQLPKAQRLILGCHDPAFRTELLAAAPDDANAQLFPAQPIDPDALSKLFIFFWINVDKGRKLLFRDQDFTIYPGLHLFRTTLARLLFMEETGTDCGDITRITIHGLKATAAVLNPNRSPKVGQLMGAAATNRVEMCQAQSDLQEEVARVGRVLAERHGIDYPAALEQVVMKNWREFMEKEL
ncbi:MAG: nucleotidyltransferase domain-containing protein [Caldilineaceae bacterium]